jgi:hypothetical protein
LEYLPHIFRQELYHHSSLSRQSIRVDVIQTESVSISRIPSLFVLPQHAILEPSCNVFCFCRPLQSMQSSKVFNTTVSTTA